MNTNQKTNTPAVVCDAFVRHLPDEATCHECGHTAGEYGTSDKLDDIGATERHLIIEWSEWRDGKYIARCEPEHFPMDKDGHEWQTCGYCGCARWNLPNVSSQTQPPNTNRL